MKPDGVITCEEWATLPIEKLVQRTIFKHDRQTAGI
jgi:hypothetical protein